MPEFLAAIICFRCGQGGGNSDGYLRRVAVKVLVNVIDDLELKPETPDHQRRRLERRQNEHEFTSSSNRRGEVLDVLTDSLSDFYSDIRKLAAVKVLALAEVGDMSAAQAVLQHIETCFELGLGCKDLGSAGHQVCKETCQIQSEILNEKNQVDTENQLSLEVQINDKSVELQQALAELGAMVENGFVSKIRDKAFPPKHANEDQRRKTHFECDHLVSVAAAEYLLSMAEAGDENAITAILDNMDDFFLLTDMKALGESSVLALARLQSQDYGAMHGNSGQIAVLVEMLSVAPGSNESINAAVQLFSFAEQGDSRASAAIVENIAVFLSAMGQAGIFRGKLRSASQALRGFID
jgi:hypothetical protein